MSSAENPTERQQTADSECKGQRSQLSDCRHLGQMNTERLPPPSVLTDVTWSCFHVCLPSWCKLIVSHPPPAGDDGVYAELPDCRVSFSYKVWRKSIFRDHKLEMMDDHMTCTHSFSNRRFESTETEPEHSGRVRTKSFCLFWVSSWFCVFGQNSSPVHHSASPGFMWLMHRHGNQTWSTKYHNQLSDTEAARNPKTHVNNVKSLVNTAAGSYEVLLM